MACTDADVFGFSKAAGTQTVCGCNGGCDDDSSENSLNGGNGRSQPIELGLDAPVVQDIFDDKAVARSSFQRSTPDATMKAVSEPKTMSSVPVEREEEQIVDQTSLRKSTGGLQAVTQTGVESLTSEPMSALAVETPARIPRVQSAPVSGSVLLDERDEEPIIDQASLRKGVRGVQMATQADAGSLALWRVSGTTSEYDQDPDRVPIDPEFPCPDLLREVSVETEAVAVFREPNCDWSAMDPLEMSGTRLHYVGLDPYTVCQRLAPCPAYRGECLYRKKIIDLGGLNFRPRGVERRVGDECQIDGTVSARCKYWCSTRPGDPKPIFGAEARTPDGVSFACPCSQPIEFQQDFACEVDAENKIDEAVCRQKAMEDECPTNRCPIDPPREWTGICGSRIDTRSFVKPYWVDGPVIRRPSRDEFFMKQGRADRTVMVKYCRVLCCWGRK